MGPLNEKQINELFEDSMKMGKELLKKYRARAGAIYITVFLTLYIGMCAGLFATTAFVPGKLTIGFIMSTLAIACVCQTCNNIGEWARKKYIYLKVEKPCVEVMQINFRKLRDAQ